MVSATMIYCLATIDHETCTLSVLQGDHQLVVAVTSLTQRMVTDLIEFCPSLLCYIAEIGSIQIGDTKCYLLDHMCTN